MCNKSLVECLPDLEKHGQFIRIIEEVDPNLERGAIHILVHQARGAALLLNFLMQV